VERIARRLFSRRNPLRPWCGQLMPSIDPHIINFEIRSGEISTGSGGKACRRSRTGSVGRSSRNPREVFLIDATPIGRQRLRHSIAVGSPR